MQNPLTFGNLEESYVVKLQTSASQPAAKQLSRTPKNHITRRSNLISSLVLRDGQAIQ